MTEDDWGGMGMKGGGMVMNGRVGDKGKGMGRGGSNNLSVK